MLYLITIIHYIITILYYMTCTLYTIQEKSVVHYEYANYGDNMGITFLEN